MDSRGCCVAIEMHDVLELLTTSSERAISTTFSQRTRLYRIQVYREFVRLVTSMSSREVIPSKSVVKMSQIWNWE